MKSVTGSALWKGCLAAFSLSLLFLFAGNLSAQVSWTKHGPAVLSPGASGEWDDQLVFCCSVIHQDTLYKMWYTGYDGANMRIGYAESPDGISWTKHTGPVLDLGAPGTWDDKWVAAPFVLFDGSIYRMWYCGDDHTYEYVGYATSPDGITWTKYSGNPVLSYGSQGTWDDLMVFSGPVVFEDGKFQMIYGAYDGAVYRAGYASSTDGINWTKSPSYVLNVGVPGSWEYPRVQPTGLAYNKNMSKYYLYYMAGDMFTWKIGYATSTDLTGPWTKGGTVILDKNAGSWDSRYVGSPYVLYDSVAGKYQMWYMGGAAAWNGSIGYATAKNALQVPAEYSTIQEAIDAAADSDVVLVSEGTYYENIRFRGKKITVASQFMVDGDTSHISKTIIDGSHSTDPDSGSAVYFVSGEDTNSVLCGFTITGGTGTKYYFNSPAGKYWLRAGGGVFCDNAGARVSNNTVMLNRVKATVADGGGMSAYNSGSIFPYLILEENQIRQNYAEATSSTTMQWSGSGGLRLTGVNARVVSNLFEEDTAIGYSGAAGGGMLFEAYTPGSFPSAYIAGNIFKSNLCKSTQEGAIGGGLCIYSTGTMTIRDNVFEDNYAECTSQTGWAEGGGLVITDQDISGYGRKTLLNNRFVGNSVSCPHLNDGGGVTLYKTLGTLSGNEFRDNSVVRSGTGPQGSPGGGAAINAFNSSFRIENNIITENTSAVDGGGLLITGLPQSGSEQVLINNTIVANRATQRGGGLRIYNATNSVSANNIFWEDTASTGGNELYITGSVLGVVHCDVQGGYPGLNNIDTIPGFVVGDTMFNLTSESQCIGKGADSLQIGTYWVYAPMFDCDGHARPRPLHPPQGPDIGAQEEQTVTDISERPPEPPVSFALAQNYPNPFNPTTTIRFEVPISGFVSLKVYDILGREVKTLVNEVKRIGRYEVRFDASGLASGVYFYRLTAGNFIVTNKMIVIR